RDRRTAADPFDKKLVRERVAVGAKPDHDSGDRVLRTHPLSRNPSRQHWATPDVRGGKITVGQGPAPAGFSRKYSTFLGGSSGCGTDRLPRDEQASRFKLKASRNRE